MEIKSKKVTALYDYRIRVGYIISTAVCFLFAAIIWYVLCAVTPYMQYKDVSAEQRKLYSRENFSASATDMDMPQNLKERVLLLPTSEYSFYRRLKFVEDAQRSIDMIMFDSYADVGSMYFYSAILKAADRGVRVRIIMDGKMGKLESPLDDIQDMLQYHNNIELYLFNEVNIFRPVGLNVLCHDKLTVADGSKMIVGGVNMGMGAYIANRDVEVMVTNSGADKSVGAALAYFEDMRSSGLTKRKRSKRCDTAAKAWYLERYEEYYGNLDFDIDVDYETQGVAADKITFLHNEISDGKKSPNIYRAIMDLAESSQKTTFITPYTLLTDKKIADLKRVARNNESFTLITNSLYNSRNVAYAVYSNSRRDYVCEEISLWEYQARDQLHAKLYSFDDRYSVVGSFNLDERSIHIDTEIAIVVDSVEFNAQLNAFIEKDFLSNSLEVGSNNEYLPSDTVSAGVVPLSKRIKYKFYGILDAAINLI